MTFGAKEVVSVVLYAFVTSAGLNTARPRFNSARPGLNSTRPNYPSLIANLNVQVSKVLRQDSIYLNQFLKGIQVSLAWEKSTFLLLLQVNYSVFVVTVSLPDMVDLRGFNLKSQKVILKQIKAHLIAEV